MDIQPRKLDFIHEFLKIQNEELISRLEKILRNEKNTQEEHVFKPMTQDELNKRIDNSESNFKNNRYKSNSELLAKYE